MRIIFALGVFAFNRLCSQFNKRKSRKQPLKWIIQPHFTAVQRSSACATYDLTYPEFNQLDTAVQLILKNQLVRWSPVQRRCRSKSFEEAGMDFMLTMRRPKQNCLSMAWDVLQRRCTCLLTSDSLISIQADADVFTVERMVCSHQL